MMVAPGVAAAQRSRASGAALAEARRFLCPHGGTPMRGGRCRPGTGADPDVTGWDRDLPAPSHAQAPCPPGTRAAGTAQPGVTRCVPG